MWPRSQVIEGQSLIPSFCVKLTWEFRADEMVYEEEIDEPLVNDPLAKKNPSEETVDHDTKSFKEHVGVRIFGSQESQIRSLGTSVRSITKFVLFAGQRELLGPGTSTNQIASTASTSNRSR